MICINDHHTDPHFNLAAEEYVLKNFSDNIFMLWRNEPSIIVGKHQNALAEINLDFIQKNKIKVVRRLTGGGAVFHDLGNINFTFIENNSTGNFKTFTQPIIDILVKLGVDARFEGRNDLTIDGKKFSGNAQCVYKHRTQHHGTLLFSATMTDLSAALRVNPLKFEDKAVRSVRSRVTNISEHLKQPMDVLQFRELVMEHIVQAVPGCKAYEYNKEDISQIEKLRDEKYTTWDWNFGHSPKYSFSKLIRTSGGNLEAHLNVADGCIKDIKLYGDFFFFKELSELEKELVDCVHERNTLLKKLNEVGIQDYIRNTTAEEVVEVFF
ncbi:MAG: lipoate--protein ligase [Prevotellaceae bacterium]|jgi:lipoate-protein ligase A|nr:lipoate--protein ligase [Prevotellaceae bacterium]